MGAEIVEGRGGGVSCSGDARDGIRRASQGCACLEGTERVGIRVKGVRLLVAKYEHRTDWEVEERLANRGEAERGAAVVGYDAFDAAID